MTQSQRTDQTETNTTHTDHAHEHASDHTHEAPTNAPLLEGSGPKDWEEQFGGSVAIFSALAHLPGHFAAARLAPPAHPA